MPVTRDDLVGAPRAAVLWCPSCDGRFSATAGDYLGMPGDEPLDCFCGVALVLAVEHRRMEVLKA